MTFAESSGAASGYSLTAAHAPFLEVLEALFTALVQPTIHASSRGGALDVTLGDSGAQEGLFRSLEI